MGRENKEVEVMPTCYRPTYVCCKPRLPTFQSFQSCVSWTPLCIFSFRYVSHAVVSGTYPSVAVSWAWPKVLITVGWVWWRLPRGHPFKSCLGPPNLKPITGWGSSFWIYGFNLPTLRRLINLVTHCPAQQENIENTPVWLYR